MTVSVLSEKMKEEANKLVAVVTTETSPPT